MSSLIIFLLQWSLMATIFLGLYHLIVKLFKKKLSRKCRYILLLLVVCRMVIPFGVNLPGDNLYDQYAEYIAAKAANVVVGKTDEATIDSPNTPDKELKQSNFVDAEAVLAGIGKIDGEKSDAIVEDSIEQGNYSSKYNADSGEKTEAGVFYLGEICLSWPVIFICLWALGAVGFLLYYEIGYRRWKEKILLQCEPADEKDDALFEELYPGATVDLLQCEIVNTPLLCGNIFPYIILPKADYVNQGKSDILENILRHEMYHAKRMDLLWKHICILGRSIHWFNPLLHTVSAELNRCCELSCDEGVTRSMDAKAVRSYGETILRLAATGAFKEHVLSNGFCREKEELKERLEGIMENRKNKGRIVALSLAMILIMSGCGTMLAPDQGVLADTIGTWFNGSDEAEQDIQNEDGDIAEEQLLGGESEEELREEQFQKEGSQKEQSHGKDTMETSQTEDNQKEAAQESEVMQESEEALPEVPERLDREIDRDKEVQMELEQYWETKAKDILLPDIRQMYYKRKSVDGDAYYKNVYIINIMAAGQETELWVWDIDTVKHPSVSENDPDWDYGEYSIEQEVKKERIPFDVHKFSLAAAAALEKLYDITGYSNDKYTVSWSDYSGNIYFSVGDGDPEYSSFFHICFAHKFGEEILGVSIAPSPRYISNLGIITSERSNNSPISSSDLKTPKNLDDMSMEEAALWYYENYLPYEAPEVDSVAIVDANMATGKEVEVYTTGKEAYYVHLQDDNSFISIYGPYQGHSGNHWINPPED